MMKRFLTIYSFFAVLISVGIFAADLEAPSYGKNDTKWYFGTSSKTSKPGDTATLIFPLNVGVMDSLNGDFRKAAETKGGTIILSPGAYKLIVMYHGVAGKTPRAAIDFVFEKGKKYVLSYSGKSVDKIEFSISETK